jgi:hypothetical protein
MRALVALMILILPVTLAQGATAGDNLGGGLAGPAPGLELTITLSEGSVEVAPSESAPGIAQLEGTVTVQMPSLRGATVTLTSSTDIGWVTQISPSTFVLDNGQEGQFSVTVIVPQGTAASISGLLMVNGRAVANGIQTMASTTATINVRPYYRVFLDAQKREVEIAPGGTARFSLRITNAGNAVDSFDLKFSNQKELEKQGWELTVTTTNLASIVPGEYRTVGIALKSPASISPYKSQATSLLISVVSLGAREHNLTVAQDYALTAKEAGFSAPGLGVVAIVAVAVVVGAVFYWRRRRRAQAAAPPEESSQSSGEGA